MTDTPRTDDTAPDLDPDSDETPVDPRLLDILVCPLGKGPLEYDRDRQELISRQAGLAYPIRDGVPIMLIDEARPLDEPEPVPGVADRPAP